MADRSSYWFPAKRYGWGWGPPETWQGWVVLVVWISAVISGGVLLRFHHVSPWPYLVGMVLVLLIICYAKGEPPRWRWGRGPEE
jgi:membrane protein YdbS with pleckstrin-like domain